MKVITEALLREELHHQQPKSYLIEQGKILSPAGREYLQQRKIAIVQASQKAVISEKRGSVAIRYIDSHTDAALVEKPEYMTQLHGNCLVEKSHPKIAFRSGVDNLQAEIVLTQAEVCGDYTGRLINDLDEILGRVRQIMRCEVLNEGLPPCSLLGLDSAGLRDHSHHPEQYYHIKQMTMPDHTMGIVYARLNLLRTKVRQVEVLGAKAFKAEGQYEHGDIMEALNRLSSAMHIMMCKYLAGDYDDGDGDTGNR